MKILVAFILVATPALADGTGIVDVEPPAFPKQYRTPSNPPGTVFDLTGEAIRFRVSSNPDPMNGPCAYNEPDAVPTQTYPLRIGGTADATFLGGYVYGDVNATFDRQIWESNGGYCNSAAVMMDSGGGEDGYTGPSMTSRAEGMWIDDAWDGIRFATGTVQDTGVENTVHNVYMHTVRDDAIESDKLHGLTVTDSLLEDVTGGISMDAGPTVPDHRNVIAHFDHLLIGMVGFPHSRYESGVQGFAPFKMVTQTSPSLDFRNSIISFDTWTPDYQGRWHIAWERMSNGIGSCDNNMLLWLGEGPLPDVGEVPECFIIQTGPEARQTWNAAVSAWKAGLKVAPGARRPLH